MLRVAICTDGIFPEAIGGMQRHSRKLIEGLSRLDDISIHVIHPHSNKIFQDLDNIIEYPVDGINPDKNYLWECWNYSKRVATKLETIDPDVIYSQGLSVWNNVERFKDRLIINPHGLEPYQGLTTKDRIVGYPFRLFFDHLFNQAAVVISLGGMLTNILRTRIKSSKTKLVELPNAVEIPDFSIIPEEVNSKPRRVLFVGRFASNKGITVLMETIDRLNQKGLGGHYDFYLAGKGPLFDEYKSKYKRDNITFLGFVSDEQLTQLYKSSDLFVLPTLFEGMPTVVLEAMSYGLPIIVTNVGATAELVDSKNGYLIKKGSFDELEKALVDFSKLSLDALNELREYSRHKVEQKFTWDTVTRRHYELFREMVDNT